MRAPFPHRSSLVRRAARAVAAFFTAVPFSAAAQVFNGGGISEGLNQAGKNLQGVAKQPIRVVVTNFLIAILNFASLIAVAMIIIGGIWLMVGFGEEGARDRAKRILGYTLLALVIMLFARVIVNLVTDYLALRVAGTPSN